MKKILLFLSIAILAVSCGEDDSSNGRLKPNAMVSLRCAKNIAPASRSEAHLSALEIVKQTTFMRFINKTKYPDNDMLTRGFADAQRDYANERLLMWGDDIISSETGEFRDLFIGGENTVLCRVLNIDPTIIDTIAYIPNATLRAAEKAVRAAYDKRDYTTVYKLFDEAFTFRPITGAEWCELQRQGIE